MNYKVNKSLFYIFSLTAYDVLKLGSITIKKQGFGMVTSYNDMTGDLNDGIMGLGFKSLAMSGFDTPIDNAQKSNQITTKIVSFYLNQDFSSDNGGSITFGGIDTSHISGIHIIIIILDIYFS